MELKNSEMLRDRFELLSMAEEYAGKYVSVEYLRKTVLQQTEEQIKEMDKQIEAEKPEDEDDDDDDDDDEDF
jgi:predicted secreted protein